MKTDRLSRRINALPRAKSIRRHAARRHFDRHARAEFSGARRFHLRAVISQDDRLVRGARPTPTLRHRGRSQNIRSRSPPPADDANLMTWVVGKVSASRTSPTTSSNGRCLKEHDHSHMHLPQVTTGAANAVFNEGIMARNGTGCWRNDALHPMERGAPMPGTRPASAVCRRVASVHQTSTALTGRIGPSSCDNIPSSPIV